VIELVGQAVTDPVGAGALGLAGGGVSVVVLAVVQGYFESIKSARAHELERMRLERTTDDAPAIEELRRQLEDLYAWAHTIPGAPSPPPFHRIAGPSSSAPGRPTSPGGS
jgi:hypothetical protein